jgi:hypothetical protein
MFTAVSAAGDFNGDGRDDFAEGFPSVGASDSPGEVRVRYGGAGGLSADDAQQWMLNSHGVNGHAHDGDGFGTALAVGDFNADGYDDLAIGAPGKTISGKEAAGSVTILFGSASGLRAVRDQFWSQDSLGVNGHARAGEHFGAALAAGDFDGDGDDDLAIGTPGERSGDRAHKGVVNVLFGSRREGLRRIGDEVLRHYGPVAPPGTEYVTVSSNSTLFGSVLAAGDFDGDGHDDLAATIPQMSIGGDPPTSAVDVFSGSDGGLDSWLVETIYYEPNEKINTATTSLPDEFGAALAVGDFDGDGRDDLAVSAPGEQTYYAADYPPPSGDFLYMVAADDVSLGTVHIYHGTHRGLSLEPRQKIAAHTFGAPEETFVNFGRSLAAGDFNGDGADDLAIGIPGATVNGQEAAGTVGVVYARPMRLSSLRLSSEFYRPIGSQVTINGKPIDGPSLTTVDLVFSTFSTLSSDEQIWHQDVEGVLDSAEAGDRYGALLAAGDFDGNGAADLAISVTAENDAFGATAALYGNLRSNTRPHPGALIDRGGLRDRNNQLWTHGLTIPAIS